MKITALASDSMGTRSMATFCETEDLRVHIDPAVALGPIRYGLAPHPKEEIKLEVHKKRIRNYAKRSDVLVITHYHYDHHEPDEPEIFKDKVVLLKHPTKNVNKSQKKRAGLFLENLGDLPRRIDYSDGGEFKIGRTKIRFSDAVCHGSSNKLGYVTEVCVQSRRKKFLHTSDVQGPCLDEQMEFILDENPHVLFCDGPMTYMLGFRYSKENLEASVENMIRIINGTRVKKFAVDHHLLRDIKWRERMGDAFSAAKKRRVELLTMADFAGRKNIMLEARRKQLWGPKGKKIGSKGK